MIIFLMNQLNNEYSAPWAWGDIFKYLDPILSRNESAPQVHTQHAIWCSVMTTANGKCNKDLSNTPEVKCFTFTGPWRPFQGREPAGIVNSSADGKRAICDGFPFTTGSKRETPIVCRHNAIQLGKKKRKKKEQVLQIWNKLWSQSIKCYKIKSGQISIFRKHCMYPIW